MLAKLVPFKKLKEEWETFIVKKLLGIGLNCVNEAAHSLYIKHVYNGAAAETFLRDALLGVDITIPVEERVDNAVKRVHKLTIAAKASVGQSSCGRSAFGSRGGGRRGGFIDYNGGRQQQYNKHGDYNNDFRPNGSSAFGRFNGNNSFGGNIGGGRSNGGGTCFICGSTGHQVKQCPKAG